HRARVRLAGHGSARRRSRRGRGVGPRARGRRDVHASQAAGTGGPAALTSLAGTSFLVVGGAGFVGSNLVAEALRRDVERVVVVDNFLSAEPENVPDDPRVE